jgi:hypothetical protein
MRVFVNPAIIASMSAWDKTIVEGIGVDAGVVVPSDADEGFDGGEGFDDEGFDDGVSRCNSGRV